MDVCNDGGGANTPVAVDPLDPWANCQTYQHGVVPERRYGISQVGTKRKQ